MNKLSSIVATVALEVSQAYADVFPNSDFEKASKIRKLMFKADSQVTVDEAVEIFKGINPNFSYNEFVPDLLFKLPRNVLITIAREYSVCVYVYSKTELDVDYLRKEMLADEFDKLENTGGQGFNTYRIWWD